MKIYAHRGASLTHPENTMAAFQEAIRLGADGIETDVHLTKDGQLVLTHDEEVSRVSNGHGMVKDLSYAALKELDVGGFKGPAFQGAAMPLLEDLLDLAAPTDLELNIEIKMGFVLYPGIEEKLLALLTERAMLSRVFFSSFNHYSLVKLKSLAPEVRIAPLYMEGLYQPYAYAEGLKSYALHPEKILVNPYIVEEAHKRGLKVHPFTINDPDLARTLQAMGVDGIITDDPEKMIETIRS